MIRPESVSVSVIGDDKDEATVWLYFDASLLVEMKRDDARTLVVDLAEHVGMFATVHPVPSPRELWRQLGFVALHTWRRKRGKEVLK
ncbi:MAG TPA: hypothetical protein VIU15_47935 [Streptomyces sp.]